MMFFGLFLQNKMALKSAKYGTKVCDFFFVLADAYSWFLGFC
jgi:hypothetical protein